MKRIKISTYTYGAIFIGMVCSLSSCVKSYLPEDRIQFNNSVIAFKETEFTPRLGRAEVTTTDNVVLTGSAQPLSFKLLNLRAADGSPAPELTTDVFPVKVWTEQYTGEESSLQEIERKRKVEGHHLFEMRPHSGQFVMWAEASSKFVKAQPDSGYIFDVEVSNSGGSKYISGLRLKPQREIPYETGFNNFDLVTGQPITDNTYGANLNNVYGSRTNALLNSPFFVKIFFRKKGEGSSLTFKFLDTLQAPINPKNFALTNWEALVHGFDMTMTDTEVKYNVAYPIPLVKNFKTKYTNNAGTQASTLFRWDRRGFGNALIQASMSFDFAIYEQGDWEIVFWFYYDNPKFTDG